MPTETESIDALYRRFFPMIQRKCQRMLFDAAEAQDAAQEAFARLWSERHTLRDDASVVSWLYRTATRLAIDRLRSAALARATELDDDLAIGPNVEASSDSRRLLRRVAAEVPPAELEAVLLSRLDGLGQGEAAALLGVSERTVRRLLRRFDARLEHIQNPWEAAR